MNNSTTDGYFLFFYRHRAQLKAVIETLRFFEMKGDEIKLTTTDFSLKKLDQLNNIGSLNTRKNTLKRISGIFRFLFRSPIFCWLLSWKTTWHINSKIKKIHSLLINNNIKGLLVCGDRGFPEELLFCYLAKKHEIPVYLLPNSFPATIYSMNLVREPFLYNELPPSFITSMIPAKNIKKLKERSFYYYKPSDALSLTRLNVFPEDPWVNGNSYASIIFLEKQNDLLNYNNNSQSVSKIVVGHPELDSLWKNLHEQEKKPMKLIKKYSINPNLPIIVIALPQHGEHRLCSWEKHWQIINNIRKSIENKEMNFLISLHPKMDPNMYKNFGNATNIHIIDEVLSEVLPVCDVFINTFSSTTGWSLLCRKKTLLYNPLNLQITNFYEEFNLPIITKAESLIKAITELLKEKVDPRWDDLLETTFPNFNGKCNETIYYEIKNFNG